MATWEGWAPWRGSERSEFLDQVIYSHPIFSCCLALGNGRVKESKVARRPAPG